MADVVDEETRSAIMSSIGSRDTEPEMVCEALLHGLGAEYEAHAEDLPGTPDFVVRDRDVAIFVHGCFWHRHDCPDGNNVPSTNRDYWTSKFERNVERDREARRALEEEGWTVVVVWGCELSGDAGEAEDRLREGVFDGRVPVESWAEAIVEPSAGDGG